MKQQICLFIFLIPGVLGMLAQQQENQLTRALQSPDSTFFLHLFDVEQLPASIGKFTNLSRLELINQGRSHTDTLSLPAEILNCTKLSSLEVRGYHISNLEILGQLTHLEDVDLVVWEEESLKSMLQNLVKFPALKVLRVGPLTEVPPSLFELQGLTHLYFGGKFTSIPARIGNLKKLVSLSIYAPLQTIPDEISSLDSLKVIEFDGLELTDIPISIFSIHQLAELRFIGTPIQSIPATIINAKFLESIFFSNTEISTIPEEIAKLKYLKRLRLPDNKIEFIPSEIRRLKSLEILDLRNNRIERFSESLEELTSLQVLLIGNNMLDTVPKGLDQLDQLIFLDLSQNHIGDITGLALMPERYLSVCLKKNPIPPFQLLDFRYSNSKISLLPLSFFGTHNKFIQYLPKLSFE